MKKSPSFFDSLHYAWEGILFAFRNNRNLWFHIYAGVIVLIASIYLRVTSYELGVVVVMIVLVITTEMVNTAIEEMVNLITNEHRREAKIAKDVGAGMVLIASIGAILVGILIFLPHLLKLPL